MDTIKCPTRMHAHPLTSWEPTNDVWVNGYHIPEGAETLFDKESLISEIRDRIIACNGEVLVSVDGPPGSGKSYLSQIMADELRSEFPGLIHHKMDKHLKTAPGSEDRANLHRSDEDFKQLYCDDESAAMFLTELGRAEPGKTLKLTKEYSRDHRAHIPGGAITIPEGNPRVVLFEGTGAHLISERVDISNVIPVHVYVDLVVALRAKIRRDIRRGVEPRPDFHGPDIAMATRLRCLPSIQREDVVYLNNTGNLATDLEHFDLNIHTGR